MADLVQNDVVETLAEMTARHKQELKDVQYQGRQRIKVAAP